MQALEYLKRHPYVLLTVCALTLFLVANNFLAITDSAESNYALTAKEMVLSGNWVSPQIYGHYWYDKPIFYYWRRLLQSLVSTSLLPVCRRPSQGR